MGHLEPSVLEATWHEFKDGGDIECRNALVLHYTSLVRYVAAKVGGTLPAMVDRDDLISYGMFGLIDAIDKFELDKGVKFETYGVARIRGAIYDEIRALDWVPRSVRSKARDITRARAEIELELGRPATDEEVAQTLSLSLEEYWALSSQASVAFVTNFTDGTEVNKNDDMSPSSGGGEWVTRADPASNPQDIFESGEIVDLLGEAVGSMAQDEKTLLFLYYLQGMTLAEIGKILGVTESRVCQLQSRVLLSLRETLGQGGLAAA